jgi:hypothetical protein
VQNDYSMKCSRETFEAGSAVAPNPSIVLRFRCKACKAYKTPLIKNVVELLAAFRFRLRFSISVAICRY